MEDRIIEVQIIEDRITEVQIIEVLLYEDLVLLCVCVCVCVCVCSPTTSCMSTLLKRNWLSH